MRFKLSVTVQIFLLPLLATSQHSIQNASTPENKKFTLAPANTGFYQNKGQVKGYDGTLHPEVNFVLEDKDLTIYVKEAGLFYQFTKVRYPENYARKVEEFAKNGERENLKLLAARVRKETFRMDMQLVGANAHAAITTGGRSEDYINFYNHNALDVHHFQKIIYHEVYPGIDWIIKREAEKIKYEFVVRPGASPSLIKMRFDHQEKLQLKNDGSLNIGNRLGEVTDGKPVSFQNGHEVKTAYRLKGNVLSFDLQGYDPAVALVIDPVLAWSTYYGGSGNDYHPVVATDPSLNVFLGGFTESTNNIASGGHQVVYGGGQFDAYLIKFNTAGQRQWATYYGGTDPEFAYACCTDGSGNVYLAGSATSTAAIASGGHQNSTAGSGDAFLVKFNSAGVRQWGTYYGGSFGDQGFGCCTDASGNVYMSGNTSSTNNIASGGHQNLLDGSNDGFLVKFNTSGVRQWGTYYGGAGNENAKSCVNDPSGNVFIGGNTTSTTSIASGGHQNTYGGGSLDAFLAKFNTSGTRLWGTYYGGTDGDGTGDSHNVVATDAQGNVYLTGQCSSTVGIGSGGHQNSLGGAQDAFLVKFNSNGARQWGTYYGDVASDWGRSCMVDPGGNVYLAGLTQCTAGIASGGLMNSLSGTMDAMLIKFSSNGVRQWGTYYGGAGYEEGYGCAADAAGDIYLSGLTSSGGLASGGFQLSHGGATFDAFVVKLGECPPSAPANVTSNQNMNICAGNTTTLNAAGSGTLTWYSGPSSTLVLGTGQSFVTPTLSAGTYTYYAEVFGCGQNSVRTGITITVSAQPTISAGSGSICAGGSFVIVPTGVSNYSITGGSTTVAPNVSTSYSVTGTSSAGCAATNTAVVNLTVFPLPTITVNSGTICSGAGHTFVPIGAATYTFSGGSPFVNPAVTTSYTIVGTSSAGCISTAAAVGSVTVNPLPVISAQSGTICVGSSIGIPATGAQTYTYSGGIIVSPTVTTTYSVTGTSSLGCISASAALVTVTVYPKPTLTVSGQMGICSGNSTTLTVSGASSYTWNNNVYSNTIAVAPLTNTTYSVLAESVNGCINVALRTITVFPLPTISIMGNTAVCMGNSLILTGNGGINYSWSNGPVTAEYV